MKRRLLLSPILPAAALLLLAACGPREAQPWRSILAQYAPDESVRELLLVQCKGGSNATVKYYAKVSDGSWKLQLKTPAFIGKNGLGKTREGDAMTPEGDFGVLTAFGILPDPGTALPWLQVTESVFACDEEGPWYNRIVDTAAVHHPCQGEDMFHTAPQYHYGLALDYNVACVWPEGSAIFFHCKGPKPYTGGCVAVDELRMKQILTTAHPGLRVIIH